MPPKKKDWPVIVAGTMFATGLTIFFLVGVWFLADAPSLLHLMRGFPVAVWLMALGFVMALAVAGWRLVRSIRSPEPRAAPQAAAKVPMFKPVVLIVAGIVLLVIGIYTENAEIGLLTLFGEFVLLMGVMLLVHRLESAS